MLHVIATLNLFERDQQQVKLRLHPYAGGESSEDRHGQLYEQEVRSELKPATVESVQLGHDGIVRGVLAVSEHISQTED